MQLGKLQLIAAFL